jgi:hypothetical protein
MLCRFLEGDEDESYHIECSSSSCIPHQWQGVLFVSEASIRVRARPFIYVESESVQASYEGMQINS